METGEELQALRSEMATQVMIALLGTQPLVVNYHSGVLEGVAGRLGLTPPGMTEFTRSPQKGCCVGS